MVRRAQKSVLTRQAPSRRSEKKGASRFGLYFIIGVCVALLATTYFITRSSPQKPSKNLSKLNLEFNISTHEKVSGKMIKEMNYYIQKWWQTESDITLADLAQKTQRQFSFERVHFLQVAPNHVVVSVALRIPIMVSDLVPSRFVSENATVYGVADHANPSKLPSLVGVFAKGHRTRVLNKQGAVNLTPEERENIQAGLEILREGKKAGYTISQIKFEQFRGFEIRLEPDGLEVFLGFHDYRKKFLRLKKLTANMEKNGSQAARIELDYTDKAFIKRKI